MLGNPKEKERQKTEKRTDHPQRLTENRKKSHGTCLPRVRRGYLQGWVYTNNLIIKAFEKKRMLRVGERLGKAAKQH